MERVLSGAPVSVPKEFSRGNENAYRQYVEGELAAFYRKDTNVIIPFGMTLGFAGSTGKLVTFGLNGSDDFTISINGAAALTLTTSGDLDALEASLIIEIAEVDGKLTGSLGFTVDVNGRIAALKLLSNGTTSNVAFKADAFDFFDGVTERPLLSAGAGLLTINGDLAVLGSIKIGAVRWPVALKPVPFYVADGGTIQWAGGAALSAIPDYTIQAPSGVVLAAGEAPEPPTLQSATTTGATLRLKISTPGATSSVTDTTDSAGGGGDPDRVMAKTDAADAYDGVYNFRVQGTVDVLSYYDGSIMLWYHSGVLIVSPWFNDGGGWDEGPAIVISAEGFGPSDLTGPQAVDATVPVVWANAIGQHGGDEWGVSYESGGSLTDFVSVQYTKQSATGTRTGSPNGETATVLVIPKNV